VTNSPRTQDSCRASEVSGREVSGREVVVTGVGSAVTGLAGAADLLAPPPPGGGFDPETGLKGRELRGMDRASRLGVRASGPALLDAALLDEEGRFTGTAETTAVVVSSNLGTLDMACSFTDTIARGGVTALSPMGLPQTSSNVVAGWVAIRYGLRGANLTVCNGATSGLDALHWARNLIAVGRARTVVVVGVEPSGDAVTRLSGRETTDAAGAVVLECASAAAERGANARAVLAGYARADDVPRAVAQAYGALPGPPSAAPPVGLWLAEAGAPEPAEATAGAQRLDIEEHVGPLSGALGVLQCAAAVAYLDGDGKGAVLATAGGAGHDAAAAVLVTRSNS
jgi:3-oxoacyl-[acyl-carrier-protein] synthase II